MDSFKELNFSESCQTLSLRKSDIFLSSFPGKIVFGQPNFIGYSKTNSFQYKHNQFFNFYLSIINIVNFFASNLNEEKGLILTVSENTIYFWCGKIVESDKVSQKVVKLGIEFDSNILFEIILNGEQFNELIYIFSNLIFSCLCLKSFERQFLEDFADEISICKLITLNEKKKIKHVLKSFKEQKKINSVVEMNLVQLVLYYNELIILYKKMKSLNNPEINNINRIEAILNK